jgi:hypothetical protein
MPRNYYPRDYPGYSNEEQGYAYPERQNSRNRDQDNYGRNEYRGESQYGSYRSGYQDDRYENNQRRNQFSGRNEQGRFRDEDQDYGSTGQRNCRNDDTYCSIHGRSYEENRYNRGPGESEYDRAYSRAPEGRYSRNDDVRHTASPREHNRDDDRRDYERPSYDRASAFRGGERDDRYTGMSNRGEYREWDEGRFANESQGYGSSKRPWNDDDYRTTPERNRRMSHEEGRSTGEENSFGSRDNPTSSASGQFQKDENLGKSDNKKSNTPTANEKEGFKTEDPKEKDPVKAVTNQDKNLSIKTATSATSAKNPKL